MRRYGIVGFVAMLMAVSLAAPVPSAFGGDVKVGGPITDNVVLLDMAGKDVDLKAMMKDKQTLLVFFNTVCSNCIAELSYIDSLYEPKKSAVQPIAIGVDIGGPKVLAPFAEAKKYRYPILSDADYKVPGMFGISFTPAAVLFGADGNLKEVFTGYTEKAKEKVKSLFP